MKTLISFLPKAAAYFFILLFCYAAVSKLLDYENFQVQLAQSPLLSAYAGTVAWAVIAAELFIVILLVFPASLRTGLYASFGLMVAFTVYIYLILNYSDFVPCSCGGILEKMGWTEHLIFNIFTLLLSTGALFVSYRSSALQFVLLLFGLTIGAGGMVVLLFLSSKNQSYEPKNIKRRFLPSVAEAATFTLNSDKYYFAGFSDRRLYLAQSDKPLLLTSFDPSLNFFEVKKMEAKQFYELPFRNLRMRVVGETYYLYDGTVPVIFSGYVNGSNFKTVSKQDAYFSQLVIDNSSHFIILVQSTENHQFAFAELNTERIPKVRIHNNILPYQKNGIFDIDGRMFYAQNYHNMVYMYSYRNEFLTWNTKTGIHKKFATLDATEPVDIPVIELKDGSRKMGAPNLKINEVGGIWQNKLLINSSVRGLFETERQWRNNHIIDIYDTVNGHYLGSFFVKKVDTEKITDILITDKWFYIIQGNTLKKYRINSHLKNIMTQGEAENLDPE